jgi:redox-sensitive bicupin YhaK (pirin superfamily)
MKRKNLTVHTELQHFGVGPFKVKQPLPAKGLEGVSPFILLHHAGPTTYQPGEIVSRLSPHPHRGFEPVTFLFSGNIHHKDSTGSEGFLESGDVQWMTAGSGIIHSEGPSADFAREGGTMELIQLWVNLPKAYKMTSPKYQDIKQSAMPVIRKDGFEIRLVAGNYENEQGPANTFSPIMAMMVHFDAGAHTIVTIPEHFSGLIYVLDGEMESGDAKLPSLSMGVFQSGGNELEMKAITEGKLLLLAGAPIEEPVVSYGPFVMNYPGEIKQAMLDYQAGRMGILEG